MLRCAQHDKDGRVASGTEMLRCAQHDKDGRVASGTEMLSAAKNDKAAQNDKTRRLRMAKQGGSA
jgi:hypothetical protein